MWTVHSSQASVFLFGQTGYVQWDLWLAVGALISVVAVGTWAIYKIKQWRDAIAQDVPTTREEQLEHYQSMVKDGSLDPQEFARIKEQMDKPPAIAPPLPPQPPDPSIRES